MSKNVNNLLREQILSIRHEMHTLGPIKIYRQFGPMKKIVAIIVVLLASTHLAWGIEVTEINICAVEALGLMEKDGTGMWNELINKIFLDNNIIVNVSYKPYRRCEKNLKAKSVDAVPGVYPEPDFLIPKHYLGIDLITVIFKKGKIEKWRGQETLRDKIVSWKMGYDMDKHGVITVPIRKHEYYSQQGAIKMLLLDRIDFLLDYQPEIGILLDELNLSDQIDTLDQAIQGGEYFLGFSKTPKGKRLVEIFDREMEKLKSSGELHKLYETVGDPSY